MKSLVAAALVVVGMVPSVALRAQQAAPAQNTSLVLRPLVSVRPDAESARFGVHMTPVAPSPRADDDGAPSAAGNVFRAVVGVGSGALVGGWLGYFGAQVGRSDWDKVPTGEKTSLRQSYTVAGVGVGALLGYFMRPKAHARGGLPQPMNIPARTGRQLLASSELRRSIATNALEAVELDRPEWIKQQRDDEAKHGTAPRTGPVESISLVVYVGEERVGGIETLRDIAIPELAELRLYDARDARRRWGVEHRYGAIEVVPASSASASAAAPVAPAVDSTK
ncbi:MAG TPA: hypothetical protein VGP25_16535 [Gemmatimonadaceae bacterium]|nr:hypothetical protein [Gemmatimonadaceae bacterium]